MGHNEAFSRLDLLVIVVILGLFVMIASSAPSDSSFARGQRIICLNNLRRIGVAWNSYATENGDLYLFQAPGNRGELGSPLAVGLYWALSNELATPKILVCPSEGGRIAARDFSGPPLLNWASVSYFVGVAATFQLPRSLLAGDRNIENTLKGSYFGNPSINLQPPPQTSLHWDSSIHSYAGNLLTTDGNVQQCTDFGLQRAAAETGVSTNVTLFPNLF